MEPCTGVSLAALLWLDGDEDLAPSVLAMAGQRRWAEARAAWAQMGGRRRKVALVWLLFGTYLKFK